jgi:hypothetical protein
VGIFHAETGQEDLGVAIRDVVMVAVGIKKQIRRLRHEHAPVPNGQSSCQIQIANEVDKFVGPAVAIGVLANGNFVGAFGTTRRRFRNAVVLGSQILIDLDRLQTSRCWILKILDDPHPATLIEIHRHRLADLRFAGEEFDVETVGDFHAREGCFRRKSRRRNSARSEQNKNQHEPSHSGAERTFVSAWASVQFHGRHHVQVAGIDQIAFSAAWKAANRCDWK